MSSIQKRKSKDGKSYKWRVVIRIKGYPTQTKTCDRKQEAEDWAQETEQSIKSGHFKVGIHKNKHTYDDLMNRLHTDGAFEHHRSFKQTRSQFEYWRNRLGHYGLNLITPELIGKERQHLVKTPTTHETLRTPGTVNRYMAVLSSTFNYAIQRLQWLHENPCSNLLKLKDNAQRDRILQNDEPQRLLKACRESKSPYLYCVVLIALTTGARKGEILSLEWQDVDLDNKLAALKETKNGHPRTVALIDSIIAELKSIQQSRDLHKPLVFASQTAFGNVDIKKSWKQALKRANISGFRFHDLRHNFCTMAASQGASQMELSTGMGHRTLQMLQRYTHMDADVIRKYSVGIEQQINKGILS